MYVVVTAAHVGSRVLLKQKCLQTAGFQITCVQSLQGNYHTSRKQSRIKVNYH